MLTTVYKIQHRKLQEQQKAIYELKVYHLHTRLIKAIGNDVNNDAGTNKDTISAAENMFSANKMVPLISLVIVLPRNKINK